MKPINTQEQPNELRTASASTLRLPDKTETRTSHSGRRSRPRRPLLRPLKVTNLPYPNQFRLQVFWHTGGVTVRALPVREQLRVCQTKWSYHQRGVFRIEPPNRIRPRRCQGVCQIRLPKSNRPRCQPGPTSRMT